ncbi:phosphoribosylglycinamide formyltransferase [Clostridia bacterium]|nr:phosphoribosylglycinamide formyltransferase [Clostridia bacterium]
MLKVAVLVSGGGTNLQALLDNGLVANIACVIASKEGCYALERAAKFGIETAVIAEQGELITYLEERNIGLIVLAGYLKILSGEILKKFERRIVNVHPSLIPSFCGEGMYGMKVHEAALARGVKLTGATVHYVNEIVDGGEILAQKAVAIFEDDTAEILQKRVMEQAEWIILPQVVKELIANEKMD